MQILPRKTTRKKQENEVKGQEKGKKRARKGQEKLLALIKTNPYISISSIANECGMSVKSIRNLIDDLREDRLLERVGPDKGGYWKVLID
ncbi:MAG: winged helix-turn-helix transcriptional regulator, partial [Bacteroidales bacterium]|nr:winged helix-turn-helix transcriptional regulator [Bacteroidales bacterium]